MLLACAAGPPPAPVERSREVTAAPDVARSEVEAKLASLGFNMPEGPGGPARTARASSDWARCDTVIVSGGSNSSQRDFAEPQTRSASVTASYTPAGSGTRVDIGTSFEATYHHRYRNTAFSEPCETTGELERLLLDAAG